MEDSGAECDSMNCGDQEVTEEKNLIYCLDIILVIFVEKRNCVCPCLKSLPEAKVKNFGLIS